MTNEETAFKLIINQTNHHLAYHHTINIHKLLIQFSRHNHPLFFKSFLSPLFVKLYYV